MGQIPVTLGATVSALDILFNVVEAIRGSYKIISQIYEGDTIAAPVLQLKKPRLKRSNILNQDHIASE